MGGAIYSTNQNERKHGSRLEPKAGR